MIEIFFVALSGIIVGILTGLLPALPVFTGPFILYYFYSDLPIEHMLVFWLAVVSGSQFFGSVATITTRIPGEESSLIYLEDLKQFSLEQKNKLLHDTALGSFVAGVIALAFMYVFVHYINFNMLPWLAGMKFQMLIYSLAILGFFFVERKILWTLLMIIAGIAISPNNNYALPEIWYKLQYLTQGHTFYMLVLGTLLIPTILFSDHREAKVEGNFCAKRSPYDFILGIKSSLIGVIAGLIPGPSASIAAIGAYKSAGKEVRKKVIAAETANNSSVLTSALPLLILGIPINQNTLIMSNIFDMRGISINEWLLEPGVFGLSVIDTALLVVLICLVLFYVLSTNLINWYTKLIVSIHHKMKFVLLTILTALIALDISSNEITWIEYVMLLSIFTAFGFLLKKNQVSPLPFLFAAILGNKLIWLYIQFFAINS